MLIGERLKGYLGLKVLTAKALGLAMASGAGLQIGKEGPFVHIATCISHALIRFRAFRDFRQKNSRESLLLAGVAVGVGTTFSAPISGVLFAMELMMPHMYSKFDFRSCFFGSIVGSLVFLELLELAIPRFATAKEMEQITALLEQERQAAPKVLPIVELIAEHRALLGVIPARQLPLLLRTVSEGQRLRDQRYDLYALATAGKLMGECFQVEVGTSIMSVYLKCHAEHYDRTVMIVERGLLKGILTVSDLFRKYN